MSEFANDIDVDQAGNERLLLHGTKTFEVGKTIASEGFDNRVAKDGLFGKGTYFAAQTCKAAQYASIHGMSQKASQQMPGTMLLARVAIGDPFYTEGRCVTLSRALTEASDCAPALGLSWIIARLGRHLIGVHDTRRFMWHLWRFAAI